MLSFEAFVVNLGLLYKTAQFIFCLSLIGIISGLSHVNQTTTNYGVSLFRFCSPDCCKAKYELLLQYFFSEPKGFVSLSTAHVLALLPELGR